MKLAAAGSVLACLSGMGCGRIGVELLSDGADAATANGSDLDARTDTAVDEVTGRDDAATGDATTASVVLGTRLLIDNTTSPARTNYPVRFSLDTAALIAQGRLAPDCSTLRVYGGQDCASPRAFFVSASECNSATTDVWVRVPSLPDHGREVLRVAFDGGVDAGSNGAAVFDFFDAFDGTKLDRTRWRMIGAGSVSVSDGLLRGTGAVLLQSESAAVHAGTSALGVRIAASGQSGTDVELGAGTFFSSTSPTDLWAYSRKWEGVSFVSYSKTTPVLRPPRGTGCLGTDEPGDGIGPPWVDLYPMPASFLTAEFRYAVTDDRAEAWLASPRSGALSLQSDIGCTVPDQLPILLGLDHSPYGARVEQRIDYVYVRPASAPEPTTMVVFDSPLGCGSP
ncbi:MAG TPA: DUF2341 domain-containing protein [Polyangiales bacterium]